MIVVDLGCYDPPNSEFSSLVELAARFNPDRIYGFDVQCDNHARMIYGIPVEVTRSAAWIENGTVMFHSDGTGTALADSGETVDAFDFSAWLREHGPAIVKMDIEGSEYKVLEKMRADGTDALIELLVIEWHGDPVEVACPTMTWWN